MQNLHVAAAFVCIPVALLHDDHLWKRRFPEKAEQPDFVVELFAFVPLFVVLYMPFLFSCGPCEVGNNLVFCFCFCPLWHSQNLLAESLDHECEDLSISAAICYINMIFFFPLHPIATMLLVDEVTSKTDVWDKHAPKPIQNCHVHARHRWRQRCRGGPGGELMIEPCWLIVLSDLAQICSLVITWYHEFSQFKTGVFIKVCLSRLFCIVL